MVPIKMFDGRLRQNESSKRMMTDTGISKTKPSERSHEKSKIPVKNESKHGHDKQGKGRSKKVIKVEEIIIQERKEEIVEESHYTFKTSQIHGNLKQHNNCNARPVPINIELEASGKYPQKYYQQGKRDRKHPLSHGAKILQHEDVNNEKTNTGKILRKSTFTVHDFEKRDQENSGCREQDNPDGLQNREKREPVNVFKNMLSV